MPHIPPIDTPFASVSRAKSTARPTFNSRSLREIYLAEVGVKEASGNNDGRRVGEYLRYCGLDEGYAWCAAFVSWCYGQAGYAEPRNPWSPALFPARRIIWPAGDRSPADAGQATPRAGDVFGIYYANLKRIAHVGFVDEWGGRYCITVEGNTGPSSGEAAADNPTNPITTLPLTTSHIRFGDNGLVGYARNRQAGVSVGKSRKRSGLGLPETFGNGLQCSPHSRQAQTVYSPTNPIRAGPDGVYRKRRPIRTIKAVARWTE